MYTSCFLNCRLSYGASALRRDCAACRRQVIRDFRTWSSISTAVNRAAAWKEYRTRIEADHRRGSWLDCGCWSFVSRDQQPGTKGNRYNTTNAPPRLRHSKNVNVKRAMRQRLMK
ncbi:uncharacterized protein LOC144094782 [Amblyomma americanum]